MKIEFENKIYTDKKQALTEFAFYHYPLTLTIDGNQMTFDWFSQLEEYILTHWLTNEQFDFTKKGRIQRPILLVGYNCDKSHHFLSRRCFDFAQHDNRCVGVPPLSFRAQAWESSQQANFAPLDCHVATFVAPRRMISLRDDIALCAMISKRCLDCG